MLKKRAHVIISGRVQGVFFRAYTREQARLRGVSGWVRNLFDGQVEAVFEGDDEAVEHMVFWCNEGPPHAKVTKVDVEWEGFRGEFEGFNIKGW